LKKKFLVNKVIGFNISGTITRYRKLWAKHIDLIILFFGLRNVIKQTSIPQTNIYESDNSNYAFSLHPPQSLHWKYSSPVRIYRAISFDNNIPLITKNFHQHPIENIAVSYNGIESLSECLNIYEDKNLREIFIKNKIIKYNKLAETNNNLIIKKIKNLFK